MPIRDVRQKTMWAIRRLGYIRYARIASLKGQPRAGLERPLHDAMELRMMTFEVLGVPMYTRTFRQRGKIRVICTTLSL